MKPWVIWLIIFVVVALIITYYFVVVKGKGGLFSGSDNGLSFSQVQNLPTVGPSPLGTGTR